MSGVSAIPEGHHSVQPYLIFKDTVAAIGFYAKAFGAKEELCMKGPDGRVGHAEVSIGDCRVMMADENASMGAYSPEHYGGSPVSLLLYTEDCDAVYATAIAEGAVSLREPADQPYGERMSGVRDPFGYQWYIATHLVEMSKDELERL
jgi:PhnB protein